MASCITSTFGSATSPQIRLTVTEKSSTSTVSTLEWKLEYVAHGYAASTSVNKDYTAVVNGKTVASGNYNINGRTGTSTIKSGTIDISKTTSKQTINFSCSMAFNLYWGSTYSGERSASGSISVAAKTSYTVAYNANGGSGAPGKQTKWAGTDITLSNTKPTLAGHVFQGWSSTKNGSVSYSAGSKYTANASITLYAVWKANTYTVTYNANGGNWAPGQQTKTYGKDLTLSNTKATRTNYTFVGWGVDKNSTTATYSAGGTYTKNASITLYAVWKVAYTKPRISNVSLRRCTKDGTYADDGTYVRVKFKWTTDKAINFVKILWRQSNSSSTAMTAVTVTPEDTTLKTATVDKVVGNGYIDIDYTYLFQISVEDASGQRTNEYLVSSMKFILDLKKGGTGVGIGKVAETDDYLEVGFNGDFKKNLTVRKHIIMYGGDTQFDIYVDSGGDIHYKTLGTATHIFNDAVKAASFETTNGGDIISVGKVSAVGHVYGDNGKRCAYARELPYGKVLWPGASWMAASSTATLSEKVSEQRHGIVLVFSEYKDSAVQEYGWHHFFVSKVWVADHDGVGSNFLLSANNFGAICNKYLYITDQKITGNDNNKAYGTNNGITYDNRRYMLRYVLGV